MNLNKLHTRFLGCFFFFLIFRQGVDKWNKRDGIFFFYRNAEYEGLRFDSSWRLRIFSS